MLYFSVMSKSPRTLTVPEVTAQMQRNSRIETSPRLRSRSTPPPRLDTSRIVANNTTTLSPRYNQSKSRWTTASRSTINFAQQQQYYGDSYMAEQGQESFIAGQERVITGQERYITGQERVVTGQERIISVSSRVDESRSHVIGERVTEHSIKVPKKVIREDVVERVVVIPEVVRREEFIEEEQRVQERVIEVARPVIKETVVEVPEYVYVDKIVEVPEVIVQEKVRHVPKVEIQERVIEVPKIITQEKVVEVPEIEYREYLVEKVVEVPEIREQTITTEVPVPQYVDVPVPQYVQVEEFYDVPRNLPVPVELISTFEYQLPVLKPRVTNVIKFPVYLPRFIEVPIAEELLDPTLIAHAEANRQHVGLLAEMTQAVSLCEVENLAMQVRSLDIEKESRRRDLKEALREAWMNGTVQVVGETSEQRAMRNKFAANTPYAGPRRVTTSGGTSPRTVTHRSSFHQQPRTVRSHSVSGAKSPRIVFN